mmetsp:Transcript_75313/g.197409  ORF Transcript_75313/g.197409 Transcript_75313/m.197409 type:complete len:229 (-) Transcript_75313:1766-2452(-)
MDASSQSAVITTRLSDSSAGTRKDVAKMHSTTPPWYLRTSRPVLVEQATSTALCQRVGVRAPSWPTSCAVRVKLYFVPFTDPAVTHANWNVSPTLISSDWLGETQKAGLLAGSTSISSWPVPTSPSPPGLRSGTMTGIGIIADSVSSALPIEEESFVSHCTGGMLPVPTTLPPTMSSSTAVVGLGPAFPVGAKASGDCQASRKDGPISKTTSLLKSCVDCILGESGTL